jgi:tRNA 2-thiouridine synthesizing protein A
LVADHEIDAKGLRCPEPLMIVRNKVRAIARGEVLHVTATDPTTSRDLRDFCRFLGHAMLHASEHDGIFEYWIRKGG